MPEPCPFCAKPIVREYGSFRCKHCAGSSEDLIDLERKARAAEVRKQTRVVKGGAAAAVTLAATDSLVVPEPPRAPKAPRAPAKASASKAAASKKPKAAAQATPTPTPTPAPDSPGRSTKSARLRMVTAAAARVAERKKATPAEEAPPPPAPKKAARKAR